MLRGRYGTMLQFSSIIIIYTDGIIEGYGTLIRFPPCRHYFYRYGNMGALHGSKNSGKVGIQ